MVVGHTLLEAVGGDRYHQQRVLEPMLTAGNGFTVWQCYVCSKVSLVPCVSWLEEVAANVAMRLLHATGVWMPLWKGFCGMTGQ